MKRILLSLAVCLCSTSLYSADLVIAESKACDYQIIVPDKSGDGIVDGWLMLAARLTQTALAKNGFDVAITTEGAKVKDKPGLYLGATRFARAHGVVVDQLEDWTSFQKVVGRDVIIAGRDKRDAVKKSKGSEVPLALLGSVKSVCDFLRERVGVRFLFLNSESAIYPTDDAKKQQAKDVEDKTWSGTWQYRFAVTGKKGPYSLPDRTWTAWFKIPFADLGTTPKPGDSWDFNAARGRNGQNLLWLDATYGSPRKALGKVVF